MSEAGRPAVRGIRRVLLLALAVGVLIMHGDSVAASARTAAPGMTTLMASAGTAGSVPVSAAVMSKTMPTPPGQPMPATPCNASQNAPCLALPVNTSAPLLRLLAALLLLVAGALGWTMRTHVLSGAATTERPPERRTAPTLHVLCLLRT